MSKQLTIGYMVKCEGNVCSLGRYHDEVGVLLYGHPVTIFKSRRRCEQAIRRSVAYDVAMSKRIKGHQIRPGTAFEILRVIEEWPWMTGG